MSESRLLAILSAPMLMHEVHRQIGQSALRTGHIDFATHFYRGIQVLWQTASAGSLSRYVPHHLE